MVYLFYPTLSVKCHDATRALSNTRCAAELYEDFTGQFCTWWIQMSARTTDWNICSWVTWNCVKLLTEREKKESCGWQVCLVFPWRENSLIRMTFKRRVCISFWSVTSCGEVYVPDERISFGQTGPHIRTMGGTLWLQKRFFVEVSVEEACKKSIKKWLLTVPCREILLLLLSPSTQRSKVKERDKQPQSRSGMDRTVLRRPLTLCPCSQITVSRPAAPVWAAHSTSPAQEEPRTSLSRRSVECGWATVPQKPRKASSPELWFTQYFCHWSTFDVTTEKRVLLMLPPAEASDSSTSLSSYTWSDNSEAKFDSVWFDS